MKITIFSSNQPRHLNLVKEFSKIAQEVYFISEVNTVFPGEVSDFFNKSEVMQKYFSNVIQAEKKIFGDISFLPENVKSLAIKSGDLSRLNQGLIKDALSSDLYVVFGASYIKGWLIDFLIEKKAVNIHMGLSPYYRGSSCNFWALYDNDPSYVGATIHMLSKGLDSGSMLYHCLPRLHENDNPFDFTMRSVLIAQESLVKKVDSGELFSMPLVEQNDNLILRYTKNKQFTDDVAQEFLDRKMEISSFELSYPSLIRPVFG